jgi:DNA-binding response OmpR family regulator
MQVIVVDDDPIFRSLVATKLGRLSHSVAEAEDGAAGWNLIAGGSFQLALVDLEMPNFKGVELIRCIRSHPKTCRMPIVVVTSRNDADAVRDSLEAGATSFVTKPLNWSMFSNHIEYLLRLHTAAERGFETEQRMAKLLDDLHTGLTGHLNALALDCQHALDQRKALGGEAKMAHALESAVRAAQQMMAIINSGQAEMESAAGKEQSGSTGERLKQAS